MEKVRTGEDETEQTDDCFQEVSFEGLQFVAVVHEQLRLIKNTKDEARGPVHSEHDNTLA